MYDTILVATDGSEAAQRAVDLALDLATTFDARLHAIVVVDDRRYGRSVLGEGGHFIEELESRGRKSLQEIEQRTALDVTIETRTGRPNEEIEQYAEEIDADVIVLGTRGFGAGTDGPLASAAERVVRYVDRPVVTA